MEKEKLINEKTVEQLLELSRIESEENEKKGLIEDLNAILEYVKSLNEIPTEGLNPEWTEKGDLRGDAVENPFFNREELVGSFRSAKNNRLEVPPIFENK